MNSLLRTGPCAILLSIAFPALAAAEVMDKEFTLGQIWMAAIAGAGVGFALCKWRAWLVFIVCPLALVLPTAVIGELRDPYIGPAIVREAGYTYVIQSYIAALSVIIGHVLGVVLWLRRRRNRE